MKSKKLNDYKSMSGQAEALDTDEGYRELIENFRKMPYEDLFDKMADCENILKVLARKEATGDSLGLRESAKVIMELCKRYLGDDEAKPDLQYTYEGLTR